jgi:hypothetical protein
MGSEPELGVVGFGFQGIAPVDGQLHGNLLLHGRDFSIK